MLCHGYVIVCFFYIITIATKGLMTRLLRISLLQLLLGFGRPQNKF